MRKGSLSNLVDFQSNINFPDWVYKNLTKKEIPGESWCGTLGAMRRAWRGCLNAGTTGDSISTRRIPICHTVPWQPSYCLDLLNSGGVYCGVPECKQITLSHMLPGFILLANVANKTLQHYSHPWILWKALVEFQMPVQSQSTWLHQYTCPPGCSLVWCLGVGHQTPRSWCWPAGSGQSIVGLLFLSVAGPDCLGRVWRQTNLYRLPVFPWRKHNALLCRPRHICRSRDGALLGAEDKPRMEFLPRLSVNRGGEGGLKF